MIKWIKDCQFCVYESGDDLDSPVIESRKAGEQDEGEIFAYGSTLEHEIDKRYPQIQFGDGSVTDCLSQEWFEII